MFSHRKKGLHPKNVVSEPEQSKPNTGEIMRTVASDKSFHFYEGIGRPTNQVAVSLIDFRKKIDRINLSSVIFHLKRADFESWIREVIGDDVLATRISQINPYDPNVRAALQTTFDLRIRELGKTPSYTKAGIQDLVKVSSPIET